MGESKIYKIRWDVRWVFRKCKVAVARREGGGETKSQGALLVASFLKSSPWGFRLWR